MAERSPAQLFALAAGAVYLLIGLLGWLVTDQFTGSDPDMKLLGFPVNGLHNVVHLALGIGWLAAASRHDAAKTVNAIFGVTLLAIALLGFVIGFEELLNIGDGNSADNWLHLLTGAASLYFGTVGARMMAMDRR